MPAKYAEGSVSPSGKFIVQGGQWIPYEQAMQPTTGPTTEAGFMERAKALPQGDPERERALNMAVRLGEPGAAGTALGMTAAMAGGGPAVQGAGRVMRMAASPAGGAVLGGVAGYQRGGVPGAVEGAAEGAGIALGLGRAVKFLTFLSKFKDTAKAIKAVEAVTPTAKTAGQATVRLPAERIAEQVQKWREVQKFSDGQIISSLKDVYGLPPPAAKEVVRLMFGAK